VASRPRRETFREDPSTGVQDDVEAILVGPCGCHGDEEIARLGHGSETLQLAYLATPNVLEIGIGLGALAKPSLHDDWKTVRVAGSEGLRTSDVAIIGAIIEPSGLPS
jgi:hypothetical protein